MRILTLALLSLILAASASAADLPKPSGSTIVPAGAKLELLFSRSAPISGGLTEGPAVAPDGSIYFSDIPFGEDKGMIQRFDPITKTTAVFTFNSGKSNGLQFNSKGELLACEGSNFGGRRVSRWNVQTGKRVTVIDNIGGKKFNAPNDVSQDRKGRIYFSDPRYLGPESRDLKHRAVYRIDTDGSVHEATHEVSKPNGLAVSPDGKWLYVADHDNGTDNIEKLDPDKPELDPEHGDMKLYAFPLAANGEIEGKRKTLVDFGHTAGCDGMTVDAQGNIYLTVRALVRPGVMVVNSQGKEIAFIPTGQPNQSPDNKGGFPSNVEFGLGAEKSTLYITVDTSLYRIPLKVNGFHPQYGD